ncbi:MAG: IPT/TIG domain-containing protein, partial [Gemmatimonadota bacterium]
METRIRVGRLVFLGVLALAATACGDDGVKPDGPDPAILSVTPATGTAGTELHIVGTDFRTGASVTVGGLPSPQVDVAGGGDAFAIVPEGVEADQTYDVELRNTDGTSDKVAAAFTAVAPILKFVNSATKPSGNVGSTVIIEGDAFGDVQGTGQVYFGDGVTSARLPATIASPDDWTNTFIVTTVPSSAVDGPVSVMTATGESASLPFKVTQNAVFSPSTIEWTETAGLPEALSGHAAAYVPIDDATGTTVQRAYVVGGTRENGELTAQVHHAVIQESGGLDPWVSGTGLTAPRAFSSVVAATPFNSTVPGSGRLFVLGGIDDPGSPEPRSTPWSSMRTVTSER